jgi:uncharacterized protein YqfA (UPF0365 family)
MALDRAGYDVLSEVERARHTEQMHYADPRTGRRGLRLESENGRELRVDLRVKLRRVPARLLDGAAPEEVLGRVADAVVREARRRPVDGAPGRFLTEISQSVQCMHLDADSSCDILSVSLETIDRATGA